MLYMPDSDAFAGQPYAGTVAFGPSFGVSGNVGIVGPFGIEGHARVAPVPVPVADLRIGRRSAAARSRSRSAGARSTSTGIATTGRSCPTPGRKLGLSLVY